MGPTLLRSELHALLDRAADLADDQGLAQLREVLLYLSEGAGIRDLKLDVPEGLAANPVFRRHLLAQNLLTVLPAGRC